MDRELLIYRKELKKTILLVVAAAAEMKRMKRMKTMKTRPTQIQPKTTSHATISALDILPTFAALAGVNLPSHRVIDGVDISNILFDGAMSTSRSALYHPNSGCEGQIGVVETVRRAMKLT